MTQPRVYIETSIPSFYHEVRAEAEMVARRNWTRHWWDFKRSAYDVVTSVAVLDEAAQGEYPTRDQVIDLLKDVPLVPIEREVLEIVEAYILRTVMPAEPTGDALHLALASYHKCDYLLTWNCRHLANANKFPHIRRVNQMLGLFVPSLVTPMELLGEEE